MTSAPGKILSASRRTDIPAFYAQWFMDRLMQGTFEVINPVNRKRTTVLCDPSSVHSIVFWSKNFAPFLQMNAVRDLLRKGYHPFLNFTINSENQDLEPGIPPLQDRLDQLETLCTILGPDKIAWRFDPICFYRIDGGPVKDNLNDFGTIADAAARLGIRKCVTSFVDLYTKIRRRAVRYEREGKTAPELIEIDPALKKQVLDTLLHILKKTGIRLFLCCERDLFQKTAFRGPVFENACIDGRLLAALYGGPCETARDYGQRARHGCQCTRSVDVGSYENHPCFHNCFFCYANPAVDHRITRPS